MDECHEQARTDYKTVNELPKLDKSLNLISYREEAEKWEELMYIIC